MRPAMGGEGPRGQPAPGARSPLGAAAAAAARGAYLCASAFAAENVWLVFFVPEDAFTFAYQVNSA